MIYVINMLLILVYGLFLRPDKSEKKRKTFCVIVTVQLACISGFQYCVGTDYISYLKIYQYVAGLRWSELPRYFYWNEPVYLIYTKLMSVIFKENFIPYFFGMSFVHAAFLMKAIYDRKENTVWSIYIYLSMGLFYISMNQIRQLIALSIVLFSIKFIEEKNWKKYLFWILIAAGIHNSALVMLPCYFLRDFKIKSRKKAVVIITVSCIFLYFFSPVIIDNVLRKTTYGWMLNFQSGSTENMIINLLYRAALLIGCIFYIRPVLKKEKKYEILYWLSIIGIIFQIMSVYETSIARITTYFYAVYIFLIPTVLASIPNKNIRLFAKFVIAAGMLCYHVFYFVYRLDSMEYQSVFSVL